MTFMPRIRSLALLPLALVLLLLVPGLGSAWTLNGVQLDDGTCGHDLQLGSNVTASSSATPWFLLFGDGSKSSYQVSIDGTSIGTFNSDSLANVCISDSIHLTEGSHTLTARELAPNTANAVAPFTFTVDTVPPTSPSQPAMASYSDSGVLGDNTTMFANPALTGTAQPGVSILYYQNGSPGFGGTVANSTGQWSAKTISLSNGAHSMTALAQDEAGNQSVPSPALQVTVDSVHPTVSITNPAAGAAVSGTVNLAANAGDNLAVWKVAFQVDSTTLATDTASPYSYSWNSAAVANGTHTLTTTATDTAGNTTTTTETITVQNNGTTTTPSAPTLNSAASGNGTVALIWSAPTSNGGSAITGYRVYRGTTSGSETLLTTLGNVTSWSDTGLTNGTTYYYKVSALNAVGESVASNELSAKPATTPGAPTLNSATPGNGTVALAWSAPASSGGSAITGYRVYRGTASGTETLLTTLSNVTSFTDTGLTNGTTYYYKVSALNSVGESGVSNELSAKPAAGATAPGAPTLNSAAAGNGTVALGWSAPGSNGGSAITGYKVYRGTASGGETLLTTLSNVTSFTDTGLTNGTTYYYKVSALNSVGESVASNELSAKPAAVPGAPTLNSATPGNGTVALAWSAPTNNGGSAITGYRVYRGTASGGETLLTTLSNVTSFSDTGLTNGTTYYYKVSALNAVGESVTSNEMSAKPSAPTNPPGAPTLNSATPGNGTVALAWSAPTNNGGSAITGYRVYRSTASGGETLLTTLGNVTSFADSGLTNGTTYYYKVSALNSIGESVASNELSARPAAVPGAPALTNAVPGNASVSLSWSTPSSNGSAITGYRIYRGTTSGGETLLTTVGSVNSWTDPTVANGVTYYYEVSALNFVGEGAASNELSARPATSPGPPTLTTAALDTPGVTLSWTTPGSNGGSAITGYRLYRGTSSGQETLLATVGVQMSYTDTTVSNGATYYYEVTAVNAVGESARSNELSVKVTGRHK